MLDVRDYLRQSGIEDFLCKMAEMSQSDIFQYVYKNYGNQPHEGNLIPLFAEKYFNYRKGEITMDDSKKSVDEVINEVFMEQYAQMIKGMQVEIYDELKDIEEPTENIIYAIKKKPEDDNGDPKAAYVLHIYRKEDEMFIPIAETDENILEDVE